MPGDDRGCACTLGVSYICALGVLCTRARRRPRVRGAACGWYPDRCAHVPVSRVLHTQVGDILLKVDGSEVHSTEDASKLILGERGTKIAMLFKRFEENEKGEGKIRKFTVHLVRGTASGGG